MIPFLRRPDEAIRRITNVVEMPDLIAENLVMSIRQNKGVLSRRRRDGEFNKLRDDEVALLEGIVHDAFDGFEEGSRQRWAEVVSNDPLS